MEQRKYMQDDIWRFLYTRGVEDFDDMTSLSKDVRAALKAGFEVGNGIIKSNLTSKDGTRKWLIGFGKGADIETVLIPSPTDPKSGTVCVSSQVGCSLSCSFCHTGTQKLLRNLAANEILSQIMHAMRSVGDFPLEKGKRRNISNIVFMGQGEPLYNFRNVSAAISLLTSRSALNMARWRITLSTSGVAPLMERVGKDLGVGLAVSLHAVTDPLRDVLVPLNKQYPIKEVLNGCHKYLSHMPNESRHRRITFEYVMLDGVNDTPADARHLTRLIGQMPSHVNLIPFNPWPGSDYKPSTDANIQRFRKIVDEAGIACHVRLPKGQDIMAACGQLKSSEDRKRIRAAAKTLDPVQE
ncbi:hypothetical protein PhCBS80983_g04438 [Powellomyces hirtus]|uniref:Radical SAM core domain-containing protein n=1 Tax=Powellomyces hirtus TaxID=109895 RepID=A0A507DZK8_9FUNG|nr:hypothetical protein PhCBS80983_g04438 [Powellomyces hirtus]